MPHHHNTTKKKCIVDGCNGQTRGKDYCTKHLKDKKPAPITSAARLTMRSGCHNAACIQGEEKHEYGFQICAKCNQPCQWKNAA